MALPNVIYNKPGFNPLACRALRNFRKILLLLFLFHVAKLIGLPLIIRHRMREPVIRVGAPQEREAPGIGFKDSSRGSVSNLRSGLPQGHSSSRLNAGQCCKLNSESGRIDVGSCHGDREPVDDVTSINKMTKINSMLAQRLCLTIARWMIRCMEHLMGESSAWKSKEEVRASRTPSSKYEAQSVVRFRPQFTGRSSFRFPVNKNSSAGHR